MMELYFFFKPGCPYCRQAEGILKELYAEHPEYESITMNRVDETADPAFADRYDYWYVPSFFLGKTKLYEADPSDSAAEVKAKLNEVFQKVKGEVQ